MLKVELTENYAGVKIIGDYNDLDYLYDSISYFLKEDAKNIQEYTMQNHLYGFLYDVRHAYQGDREYEFVSNSLQDFKREWFGIKKKDVTDNNFYYSFNILLPDLILDMILIKYFINDIDEKDNNIYNPSINMVNFFYSLVLQSLNKLLSKIKFNKVKEGIMNATIDDRLFIPQWFEIIAIDYANMTKKKREKEFMHIMDRIYNYINYKDYFSLKRELEKMCKEKNCNLDNINYEGFPNDIEW